MMKDPGAPTARTLAAGPCTGAGDRSPVVLVDGGAPSCGGQVAAMDAGWPGSPVRASGSIGLRAAWHCGHQ